MSKSYKWFGIATTGFEQREKGQTEETGGKAPGPRLCRGTWTWPTDYSDELGHGPIAMVKETGVHNKAEQAG